MNSLANLTTETPRTTEVTQRNSFSRQTLKGCRSLVSRREIGFGELLQSSLLTINVKSRGVAPGCNWRTPSAFGLLKYVIALQRPSPQGYASRCFLFSWQCYLADGRASDAAKFPLHLTDSPARGYDVRPCRLLLKGLKT